MVEHDEFISVILVHFSILELFAYRYNIERVACNKSKVHNFMIQIFS